MRYQRVISRCSIFKFWKVCSKTNDSFIILILLTISGDCREALPSFPPSNLPLHVIRGLRNTGRDDRVIVQTIPQSPPAFYLEILYFSYNLTICEFIGRAIREDRAPFFSYPQTATDETIFSVCYLRFDVYHYLVCFKLNTPIQLMFCRDKEATAVATALHSYDYYPRPPRGSRVSPYSKDTHIVIFTIFAQGRCPRGSYSPFSSNLPTFIP